MEEGAFPATGADVEWRLEEPMNAPAPQTAAAELWNALASLTRDDRPALDRLLWPARKLARQRPADVLARLSLADALLRSGQRDEGIGELNAAWDLRRGGDRTDQFNLALLLAGAGALDRSQAIFEEMLERTEAAGDQCLFSATISLGLRAGNLDLMRAAETRTGIQNQAVRCFIETIEDDRLTHAFTEHQNTAQAVVAQSLCSSHARIYFDECGEVCVGIDYYTNILDDDRRFELYSALADRTSSEDHSKVADLIAIGFWGPEIPVVEAAA